MRGFVLVVLAFVTFGIAGSLSGGHGANRVHTPSETDVLVAAYVNHQLPNWAQVEPVPNTVRSHLHLPKNEPAVMIIVKAPKWHGDDTVILTASGQVYES